MGYSNILNMCSITLFNFFINFSFDLYFSIKFSYSNFALFPLLAVYIFFKSPIIFFDFFLSNIPYMFLTMWTIHLCVFAFGYIFSIASESPLNPSNDINNISSTPLAFISSNTSVQNVADSFSFIHIPNTSFFPSLFIPSITYIATFSLIKSLFTGAYKQSTYING